MKVNFSLFLTQKRTCPKVLPKYGKEIIYYYSSYLIIYQLKSTLVKSRGANRGMVMIFTTLMRLMMWGFLCRFWSEDFPRLTWTFINPILCVKISFASQICGKMCMFTYYVYTVWRFQDFSVTQIIREINFGESRNSKTAIVAILRALNLVILINFKCKFHRNQNSEPLNVLKWQNLRM